MSRQVKIDPRVRYLTVGANPHPLFDSTWYLAQYADVREASINPLVHYIQFGAREGRDPHPLFDSDWYLAQYPDVLKAGINPLVHYIQLGAGEGRDPHPLFDSDWYLAQYPDVLKAGINPLVHYIQLGAGEGRDPHPLFDSDWYLAQHADVREASINPLVHYIQLGAGEGRDPHPLFDSDWYLAQHADVREASINPLVHYIQLGAGEGRDPHPLFDSDWYLAQYPDVLKAGINPLVHYIQLGAGEGRDPHPLFDSDWYLAQHADVREASINPLVHYIQLGAGEGRDPHPLFDSDWYLAQHADVREASINPLVHYIQLGAGEGRDPHPLFDSDWYLAQHADVREASINPLVHYIQLGAGEGRDPHPLFDSDWYLAQHADVREASINPLVHYIQLGAGEGRDPHPLFDSDWYLAQHADVREASINPLVHYIQLGAGEGRDPHPLFDSDWYLAQHADVREASINPLVHYIQLGAGEGRDPHPLFDSDWYLAQHADVREASINPLVHYIQLGAGEGRDPHPLFDSDWYLAQYPDVLKAGINPLVHYIQLGAGEGRDPHPLFDSDWYLAQYPDVLKAGINPLVHYIQLGAGEGRDPHPLFDSDWYLAQHADVREASINPLVHYIQLGAGEGRDPHPLFDSDWYLAQYPDVLKAGINPLVHYIQLDGGEGRDPHPLFDSDWYLAQYPDVLKAGINPLVHYIQLGAGEGRDPHPLFTSRYYHDTYIPAEDNLKNPLIDYVETGAAIGQNPNPAFDAKGYRYEHQDVSQFGQNALLHYVEVGRAARFDPHPLFERDWYVANNPDVRQSGIDAYEHYVRYGLAEGRLGSRALGNDPNIRGPFPLRNVQSEPEVTIIIPIYRSYFDTYRCLVSISRLTGDNVRYKVVLVDDCPDNPVTQLLTEHPSHTVVSNERNLGFLLSCNRAAELTNGKFIIFLNNDTVVRKNWLSPMVAIANRNDRVAMVGCKLLNSDGTIQEAGGSILRNGWGSPYGRNDDPSLPKYNYVREVDCVIGACILVRRSVFASLGGFDSGYAPGFYEEFDLAFAFQELNYRVLYQPASEVYHFGSASYGAQTRDHQSFINHAKFCKKWATRLVNQPAGEPVTLQACERPKRSGTILVIDEAVPEHDKHAGALTIFQYLQLLVQYDFKVIFLPYNRLPLQPYTRALQQIGVEVLYGNFNLAKWLGKVGQFINWVLIARPHVANKYIGMLRSKTNAYITYYTHDLHFLRERRRYDVTRDPQALAESLRLKAIEAKIFNSVDCVTSPSDEEAPIIRQLAPGHKVRVVSPFFFNRNSERTARVKCLESRNEVIFVGHYGHLPNVDAAIFLVNSVMPLVWREIPSIEVLIVGSNPPPAVTSLHGNRVKVVGYVPDLAPYYERARVSVSPLRYGSGVKGKIISSLEAGVPVVTTTIGNEGIALRPDDEVLVGNTPEELAGHVVRLFRDNKLLNALAAAGRRVIADRFSEEKARDAFFDAIELRFCSVCGNRSPLTSRIIGHEEFTCEQCGALSDVRALANVLIYPYRQFNCPSVCEAFPFLAELRIHEFGTVASIHELLRDSKNFSYSSYDDLLANGWVQNGLRQHATVHDEVLDLCISQEIIDLLADTAKRFTQIYRILKPGGRHVFTAKFNRRLTGSIVVGLLNNDTKDPGSEQHAAKVIPPGGAVNEFDFIHLLEATGFIVNFHGTCCADADDQSISVFEIQKAR